MLATRVVRIRGWRPRRLRVSDSLPIEDSHVGEPCGIPFTSFFSVKALSSVSQNATTYTSGFSSDVKMDDLSAVRDKILEAALPKVPEFGWTLDALAEGARDAGFPRITHGLFPNGGLDLVAHVYRSNNRKFMENMKDGKSSARANRPVNDFFGDAIQSRLKLNIPYMDSWTSAIALLGLPQNLHMAFRLVGELIDEIWYSGGDHTIDSDWYTKRLALASVYEATELHMLQDNSPDYSETWEFLARRLEDFDKAHGFASAVKKPLDYAFPAVRAASTTFANVTGLNQRRYF